MFLLSLYQVLLIQKCSVAQALANDETLEEVGLRHEIQ